eukprot:scaffold9860_cov145-Skeletonema_menzelii.AAC.6
MTAKKFSDVLGCRFKNEVDDYDDTDEGRLQQKRGRENLKMRMKHALGECKKRLSAVTYTRIVSLLGVEHTFQYDWLSDTIHKAAVQYYDANRHIEAFADDTKEQGLVNLLSLPIDQFNNAFDGRFDINAVGFVESKNCVKEYFTKLTEQASTATTSQAATAPAAEQFQMMMQFMSASTSNIDTVARTSASNIDAVARTSASNIDALARTSASNINAVASSLHA